MRIEWWILISVYAVAVGILFFIPRNKIRLAVAAFLFMQVITFLAGLVVVELGMIEYPVRIFASVNRSSYDYEFFLLPVIGIAFIVWYPNGRSVPIQLGYYAGYSSVLSGLEVLIEKHTELVKYIHWEWYYTWITVCASFVLLRLFCGWFYAKEEAVQS